MMSPKPTGEDRGSPHFRHTPLQIIHIIGNFLRIWSVYSMYRYLSQTGASVVLFIFSCLVPSSILFLTLQKPWKGRPLSNQQVVPSIINGAITALYFILWVKGLKSCGPLRAILAEYSGAVLGVLSAALYGRRSHLWKKVGGLIAMLMSFYFLSQGWAMATYSPFSFKDTDDAEDHTEEVLSFKDMIIPILAGILSALRRVIARRVSLKNQLKRRLHAITITSATCFLFPVAMWDFIIGSTSDSSIELPFSAWAFLSTILFGVILIFYVDGVAEERLHMVFSSPRHLLVAGGCIIILEIVYKMDFSLPGFIICALILGFGFSMVGGCFLLLFMFSFLTRDDKLAEEINIYDEAYIKPPLWNEVKRVLCSIQTHQMAFWKKKYKWLHCQLESINVSLSRSSDIHNTLSKFHSK